MTMPAFPALGDTSWRDDWAQAVHNAAAEIVSGRLAPAALTETAQDAAAAALAAGTHTGISFTYDDANNRISAAVTGGGGGDTFPSILIDAADYGWATSATAAQNDTAFAAAWAAAKAAKLPLYLGPGTYQKNTGLDCMTTVGVYAGGVTVFGAGMDATTIVVNTDSEILIKAGGLYSGWRDFSIRHADFTPDANTGDGIVFYKVAFSTFARLRIENTGRALAIAQQGVPDQSDGTSNASRNWMFSCSFTDIVVFRYSKNALYLHAVDARSTGSVFNNLYLQNPGGVSSGYPVDLFQLEESVFNQLNIEDNTVNLGILAVSCGHVVINSLHFERVGLTGWQPNYVRSYGSAGLVINGASFAFCDVAPAAAQDRSSLFSVAGGGQLVVNGYSTNNLTKTQGALPFSVVEVDDTNAGNVVDIGYGVSNSSVAFTALTRTSAANPGLKRIGDQLYALGSAVRAQTKTAAYTLVAGDAGSVIEVNSASAVTITVPSNVLPTGAVVEIVQLGAGQVTIAMGASMTPIPAGPFTTRAQGSPVTLRVRSGTSVHVSGDLT